MVNRLGNKIWKEKLRIGMFRKKIKLKKLFYKVGEKEQLQNEQKYFNVQQLQVI